MTVVTSTPALPKRTWRSDYFNDPAHGPLPALLLVLTITTGVVDAVSILSLGRVFVANMTGNVVFIGFALAGAAGFSLAASLIALVGFLVGAGSAGWRSQRFGHHAACCCAMSSPSNSVLIAAAAVLTLAAGSPFGRLRDAALSALGASRSACRTPPAQRLAVPHLTTTVLTLTLTGIAADLRSRNVRVAALRRCSLGHRHAGLGAPRRRPARAARHRARRTVHGERPGRGRHGLGAVAACRHDSPWQSAK